MKFVLTFVLLTASAFVVSTKEVDWSQVKPLGIAPRIPPIPRSHSTASDRITNGNLAKEKQFPHQVGLLLYVKGGAAWCGGSLISNRYVVTAAHCTDALTTGVDVYLGAWNRHDKTEKHQQIIFVPTRYVTVHENWQPAVLVNDISLIRFPVEIEFNDYIKPIKLPKISDTFSSYAGEEAIASGWGRISDEATGATDKLRWIEVPIMTNSGCSTWFAGTIKPSNICIKTTGGYSTCNGDSGGPLMLADGSNTLIGITSFGISLGCEKGWPSVFTRVTSYLDWIKGNSGVYYE